MFSHPSVGRKSYRIGDHFRKSTFGLFPGYLQTNVTIVPKEQAENFRQFCQKNPGPCPLIYESAPGQTDAPTLGEDSDIRTDLPTYQEYQQGNPLEQPSRDLLKQPWEDMVTFHLGCSFSFDSKLVENGIELDCSNNVPMFITNVPCQSSGPFNCNMAVSMRPVPVGLLDRVLELSVNMDFAHGAPIQIGSPEDIGVRYCKQDELESSFGGKGTIPEGSVPCFWACGVTGNLSLRAAGLPKSFSHYPGSMFVTDVLSDDVAKLINFPLYPKPRAVCTDANKSRYVSVSEPTLCKLTQLEDIITVDPGNRGLRHLIIPGEFARVCLELSSRAKVVGILLGFPLFDSDPAEENDGIAGAIYLARGLQALNIQVHFIVDDTAGALIQCLSQCVSRGFTHRDTPCLAVGSCTEGVELGEFTHLIAIERPSRAVDGRYYTMTARDISERLGGMGEIFRRAGDKITTIGIGDGGNELGMGKVRDRVVSNIPHGAIIAADVGADLLVSCGVSNWGGQAIAAGLAALQTCPVHDRYRRKGIGKHSPRLVADFILSPEKDRELHEWLRGAGFRDGCTGRTDLTVDGLDYNEVHSKILQDLSHVVNED